MSGIFTDMRRPVVHSDFVPDDAFPSEEAFETHFQKVVVSARAVLSGMPLAAVGQHDLTLAGIIVNRGGNVIDYYRARFELTEYDRSRLDAFAKRHAS